MQAKETLAVPQKRAIAAAAAALIHAEDFVFIDAGSTTLELVRALEGEALQANYVTNAWPMPARWPRRAAGVPARRLAVAPDRGHRGRRQP